MENMKPIDAYNIVATKSAMYALQNHIAGECVYCEEDQKIYIWQEDDGWQQADFEGKGITMNLYDLNKSIINQLPIMSNKDISAKIDIIEELHKKTANDHYMLLCKEYSYYTIFESDCMLNMPSFGAAVCEIISTVGDIYSIEPTEDKGAIEIWIKPDGEEDALAFYLFPYDGGVVYYG